MNSEDKKISFSFCKKKRASLVVDIAKESKEKVEFIDCFDGSKGKFTYKGSVRKEDTSKRELVIPMISSNEYHQMIHKTQKRFNSHQTNSQNHNANRSNEEIQKLPDSQVIDDIDQRAVAEILSDVKNCHNTEESSSKLVILCENAFNSSLNEAVEPVIDYEEVPVCDFGTAMLRGMGWRPELGLGKEPRLIPTVTPKLRPRGLGLGAKPALEDNVDKVNPVKNSSSF